MFWRYFYGGSFFSYAYKWITLGNRKRALIYLAPQLFSVLFNDVFMAEYFGANYVIGHRSLMPINGFIPTSLPGWRMSNKMLSKTIGPIRSRGTKPSILIGPLEKRASCTTLKLNCIE